MKAIRNAAGCRWAAPTLFLPAPYWFEAETCTWTCVREPAPAVLATTEPCEFCPWWEPRRPADETNPAAPANAPRRRTSARRNDPTRA
jgi:hypothetical protein